MTTPSFVSDPAFPDPPADDGLDPVLDGCTQALGGLFVGHARDASASRPR